MLRRVRKVAVTVAGVAVVAAGVALLVLPGPGLVVVVLGLGILATEYEWARRSLKKAQAKARQASDATVQNPWSTGLTLLFGLGVVAVGVSMFVVDLPLPGWGPVTGGVVAVTGLLTLGMTGYSYYDARRREEHQGGRASPDREAR